MLLTALHVVTVWQENIAITIFHVLNVNVVDMPLKHWLIPVLFARLGLSLIIKPKPRHVPHAMRALTQTVLLFNVWVVKRAHILPMVLLNALIALLVLYHLSEVLLFALRVVQGVTLLLMD